MSTTTTTTKTQVNSASGEFRQKVETPSSVGRGLHIHQQTRSKKLLTRCQSLILQSLMIEF